MGCDIHLHIECKINGEWYHYNHPDVKRDYDLFAKMAGVRGDIDPISEPRGLPDDITFLTQFDAEVHWGIDGHSHSYLTVEEIQRLKEWYETQLPPAAPLFRFYDIFGFLFGNSFDGILKYPNDYPFGVEDVRFVFWFDN